MTIADAGLKTLPFRLDWDVRTKFPAVYKAIQSGQAEGWLVGAIDELVKSVPVPDTCESFGGSGSYFRLPKHRRCFYYTPNPAYGRPTDANTRGVLAIKGAEPYAKDFDALLDAIQGRLTPPVMSMYMTQRRHAEYISVIESKTPGVLYISEAIEEADIAGELQTKHLEIYGTLARLPVPLLVHRLPADCQKMVIEKTQPRVSARGWERIRNRLEEGIAVYTYYYPSTPLRSDALKGVLKLPTHTREHLTALLQSFDADKLIQQWSELFVRFLYMGYLHCSMSSFQSGMMLQEQNVVIDGGYTDVDSVVAIAKIPNDVLFHETLMLSMFVLCRTVRLLLVEHVLWHLQKGFTDYVEKMIHDHVLGRIRRAIETEARPGVKLDERVIEHFNGTPSFEALVAGLKAFYPPPDMLDADQRISPEKIPGV